MESSAAFCYNTTMRIAIYASSNQLGSTGAKEIQRKHEEGKLFAKLQGFCTMLLYEQIGTKKNDGWYNLCMAIDSEKIKGVWVKSVDELGGAFSDLFTVLYVLVAKHCSLFIDNKEQNIATLAFRRRVANHYGIPLSELDPLLTTQHQGRLKKIDKGERVPTNIFGYNYSYDSIGNLLVEINDKEANTIRSIYSLYHRGFSFISIERQLIGAKSKMAGEIIGGKKVKGKLSRFQIRNILRRPEYCGKTYNQDHTRLLVSPIPPIPGITVAYWKKTQRLLDAKSRPNNIPKGSSPFSGFITCGFCGSPYYVRNNGKLFHKNNECKKNCDSLYRRFDKRNFDLAVITDLLMVLYLTHSPFGNLLAGYINKHKKDEILLSLAGELWQKAESSIRTKRATIDLLKLNNEDKPRIKRNEQLLHQLQKDEKKPKIIFIDKYKKIYGKSPLTANTRKCKTIYHIVNLSDPDKLELFKSIFQRVNIKEGLLMVVTNTGIELVVPIYEKLGEIAMLRQYLSRIQPSAHQ